MRRTLIALALAALPDIGAAQAVCRPGPLGATLCQGTPRPKPRPADLGAPPVQALDRVLPADPGPVTTFVPARKTRGLGGTILDAEPGRCRPDTLGNLRCR